MRKLIEDKKMIKKILEIIKSYSSIIDLEEKEEAMNLVHDLNELFKEVDLFKIRNSVNQIVKENGRDLTTRQAVKLLQIESDLCKIISGEI